MTMFPHSLAVCVCCHKPIHDKFVTTVLDKPWHAECVKCFDCNKQLNEKCFAREAKIFCKEDFYRRFGPRCGGCDELVHPNDLVRRARHKVYHLNCFTCFVCHKMLNTGDKLYLMNDGSFVCKDDYISGQFSGPDYEDILDDEHDEEDEDEDEEEFQKGGQHMAELNRHSSLMPPLNITPNLLNAPLPHPPLPSMPLTNVNTSNNNNNNKSLDANNLQDCDSEGEDNDRKKRAGSIPDLDDGSGNNKRRGPRTTIKAKQLEVLKTAFNQTPKPTRHIREQLAKETGLPMRVIQVWFQNKRSKERRMKQMSGRGKFFLAGSKLRKFGLDDPRFYFYEGRPDFGGYGAMGGPPPHPYGPDFYPPLPPPPPPPPPSMSLPPGTFSLPPSGMMPSSSMEQPIPMNLPSSVPPLAPPTSVSSSSVGDLNEESVEDAFL